MKRRLFTFVLAALTIGLLGSCSKINERIDGLDKRVYDLENNKIASVEQQITAINQSIADLETIRTNIQNLKNEQEAQGQDITDLQAADITLEGKINDLKTYVDTELAKYATKDWANATFATLKKQAEIITDVEKLKADLADLDTKLDQDIANLKTYIEGWVNGQLSGYYTIAQVDAKVDGIQSDIDALKTDNETNKSDIEKLEADLAKLTQDLATAKADIETAYKKAIKDAIEGNDGYITETIKTAIATANGKIDDLTERVGTLESDVATLKNDVAALKAMIQTVSIIPAYSNGSLKAEDGILTINCVITPKEAVESLKKENFTILTSESEVLTKSALYGTITIANDEDLVLDKTNGTATIKVDVSSVLPTEEGKALTVAVNIKNGISDYTTEFVPVYVYVAPAPVVPKGFVDLGVKDANGKPLYWAEKNLGASKAEDYGDYFAWGETAPYYEGTGGWPATLTWKSGKGSGYAWQSYCGQSSFVEWSTPPYDATTKILKPEFDAATAANSSWRTPTSDEFKALAAGCVWIWTTDYNSPDKAGYIVYQAKNDADKGKANMNGTWKKCNGSSYSDDSATTESYSISDTHIFFPATGCGDGTSRSNKGTYGYYRSSTLCSEDTKCAYRPFFYANGVNLDAYTYRYFGFSVRPVTTGSAAPTPTTTGTAKATIGGSQVDVNWVQLWENGPKFAEKNVGASSATDVGSTMTFTDATKAGANYVWGANWCTPSKDQMDELLKAASSVGSEEVKCELVKDGNGNIIGFKFTGKKTGYTDNSVFFPAQGGSSDDGYADYWSATADDSKAWGVYLSYALGSWYSNLSSRGQDNYYLVRPVFRN